jgi:hypothetical protein
MLPSPWVRSEKRKKKNEKNWKRKSRSNKEGLVELLLQGQATGIGGAGFGRLVMSGYIEKVLGVLLEDEVALDIYLAVALTGLFLVGAVACFYAGLDQKTQVKKRAWVITTVSAGLCTLASVYTCSQAPVSWDFRVRPALMGETNLSRFIVHYFRAQAVLDLALGVIFYRSQLHPLTSWLHHIAYLLLCNWMLDTHSCLVFTICCLEELPTFLLGVGTLNKDWRMDMPFGISYGILRVTLHTFLFYHVMTYTGPGVRGEVPDERIYTMRFNFVLTWCLHTHWFYGWVQQQRRLSRQRQKDAHDEKQAATDKNNSASGGGGSSTSSKSSSSSKVRLVNGERAQN